MSTTPTCTVVSSLLGPHRRLRATSTRLACSRSNLIIITKFDGGEMDVSFGYTPLTVLQQKNAL